MTRMPSKRRAKGREFVASGGLVLVSDDDGRNDEVLGGRRVVPAVTGFVDVDTEHGSRHPERRDEPKPPDAACAGAADEGSRRFLRVRPL
jgi:hypothetical protein